jgi:stage II sporulation protein D
MHLLRGSIRLPGRRSLGAVLVGALVATLAQGAVTPAQAATCPAPGGVAISNAPNPSGADLVVRGRGYGHSVGMSQYGAQGAARLGCSATQILGTYYPGTSIVAKTLAPRVRVTLMSGGTRAYVTAQSASVPWRASGGKAATQPVGSTWTVVLSGTAAYLRDAANHNVFSVSAGQTLRAVQNGRIVRVRSYDGSTLATDRTVRWDETQFLSSSSGLAATQYIVTGTSGDAVQKYLWGLAEVPSSWPTAALQTQADAARTYLVRRFSTTLNAYVVWATTRDQNYLGYVQESQDAAAGGRWRSAVDATIGRVVVDGAGRVIDAMYTSSHGGRSEDIRYAFGGTTAVSYLVSMDDSRWDLASDNPYRSWSAGFTAATLAAKFGVDVVTRIAVGAPGTTARLSGVQVTGTKGSSTITRTYTGMQMRSILGVRSPGLSYAWLTRPVVDNGIAVSGDWDGNHVSDVGWFKDGKFTLRWSDGTRRVVALGQPGDLPVVGDWNRDGKDGVGVFHSGHWSIVDALDGTGTVTQFDYGQAGDLPVAGHWTGASGAGIGVVRGSTWLMRSTPTAGAPTLTSSFAGAGRPLLGDWDGSGLASPGWMKDGAWALSNLIGHPAVHRTVSFGRAGDDPVPGDFDGNGTTTTGIARSNSFFWRNDLLGGSATGARVFAP